MVGNVRVPVLVISDIVGADEKVLTPEMVCADVRSTKSALVGIWLTNASVPVVVGSVRVPVLMIVEIFGEDKVLLARVCAKFRYANVPTPAAVQMGAVENVFMPLMD